jgi:hypothetical protein
MKTEASLYALLILLSSSSCGVLPINNQFEKAGTLKKGNMEMAGNITAYSAAPYTESGKMSLKNTITNIGARFGIGLTDKTDIKFRYEHMVHSNVDGITRMNYFSVTPKFALNTNEFSLLVPFSVYSYKNDYWDYEAGGITTSIAPQILYSFTSPKNKSDLTIGMKGDLLFGDGAGIFLFGSSIGAGFSSNLSKWAIRPEVGITFLSRALDWSYGLGFQYTMPKRKR